MYDLIIIGAGPAGITASVYAARKRMNFLVITKDIGGQAAWSGEVQNYTGYQFISGPELVMKFEEHMRSFDIPLKEPEEVIELKKLHDKILVKTKTETYESKTAIIASGKRPRELNVPGEKEFKNRGLTYCATCDGPLFKGKPVAIIGGGNSALDAALQMIRISPKVYIINVTDKLTADAVMVQKVISAKNVEVWNNSRVNRIYGDRFVKGIEIQRQTKTYNLEVDGVFVEIGLIPNSDFVQGIEKNEYGEIKVNSFNETNLAGVFAAGDVTDVMDKQIIIAAGEGAKACLSAFRYLAKL